MKTKKIAAIHAALLLGTVAVPAAAQDTSGTNALQQAIGSPDDFTLSGSFRARIEGIDGQFRPTAAHDDQLLSLRTTLFGEYHPGPIKIGGELWDSRAYLESKNSTVSTGEVNALELVQAYIGVDLGSALGSGSKTEITGGRMTMSIGSKRLVSRQNFRNTTNSYTGVKLERRGGDGSLLTAFWVMPQTRLPSDAHGIRHNDVEWDRETSDVQFYGVDYQIPLSLPGAGFEFYGYGLDERDAPGYQTTNRHLFTPGVRLYRKPKAGVTDFDLEAILQRGHEHATSAPTDVTALPVKAWFAHAGVGHTFGGSWQPRVEAVFDYGSGDGTGRSIGRFDQLYGARRFEYGPTGLYGLISRSNEISPGARIEVKPDKRWSAFAMYRALWLASRTDSFGSTGIRDATGQSGRFAGQQAEASASYWLKPKIAQLEVGYARLFKGRFLRDAPNAPDTGDTNYGYASILFDF